MPSSYRLLMTAATANTYTDVRRVPVVVRCAKCGEVIFDTDIPRHAEQHRKQERSHAE